MNAKEVGFHIALHAMPDRRSSEEVWIVEGRTFKHLMLNAEKLEQPLPITFEQAEAKLVALPRLFFEPDGSFVWVSESHEAPWQLNGTLYDRGEQLQYVELRGNCTQLAFDCLASIFRPHDSHLIVQLIRQAMYLSELSFRRYVWGTSLV